jgi:Mitochondrial carrier protein
MPGKRLPAWHDVLAGAISGGASRLATAPLDVAKIRCQLDGGRGSPKYATLVRTLRSVYSEEGVIGLWRGTSAALLLWISYTAVQFGLYPRLLETLTHGTQNEVRSVKDLCSLALLDHAFPSMDAHQQIGKMH